MGRRVTVIVLSYNRPRMLAEALDSIKGAEEVFILDDGSDFDLVSVVRPFFNNFPRIIMRKDKPLTLEERLTVPRVGRNINLAIQDASGDAVAYLCDDDLFHPDWIENIRAHLLDSPKKPHVMYAQWNIFNDGEKPGDRICKLVPFEMTTGNFAHRRDCCFKCDLWWGEKTVVSHDGYFVFWIQQKHPRHEVPMPPGMVAGWRRNHPYNMIHFVSNNGYTKEAGEVLKLKTLE